MLSPFLPASVLSVFLEYGMRRTVHSVDKFLNAHLADQQLPSVLIGRVAPKLVELK